LTLLNDLKSNNILAVLDVMIDIKNEISILSDYIQIPIMQTEMVWMLRPFLIFL